MELEDLKLQCIVLKSELEDCIYEEQKIETKIQDITYKISNLEAKITNNHIKKQINYIKKYIDREQLYAVNIAYQ